MFQGGTMCMQSSRASALSYQYLVCMFMRTAFDPSNHCGILGIIYSGDNSKYHYSDRSTGLLLGCLAAVACASHNPCAVAGVCCSNHFWLQSKPSFSRQNLDKEVSKSTMKILCRLCALHIIPSGMSCRKVNRTATTLILASAFDSSVNVLTISNKCLKVSPPSSDSDTSSNSWFFKLKFSKKKKGAWVCHLQWWWEDYTCCLDHFLIFFHATLQFLPSLD